MAKHLSSVSFFLVWFLATSAIFADVPIVAEPLALDFGQVHVDKESVELSLKLRNLSDSIVKIANARADCGCTVAELKQNVIPPKETVDVVVKVRIAGSKGVFKKTVSFDMEGQDESLCIPVTGHVVSDIWFDKTMIQVFPKQATPFEKVSFVLHTIDFPDVQFDWKILDPTFSIQEKARTKQENETQIQYELSVNTKDINETQSYRLAFVPKDQRIKPLYIPVGIYKANIKRNATQRGSMSEFVLPQQLNVGLLPRGDVKRLKIFGNENPLASLKIEKIEHFPGSTILKFGVFEAASREIYILVPENAKLGQIKGKIHLTDVDGRKFVLDVLAIVIPSRRP